MNADLNAALNILNYKQWSLEQKRHRTECIPVRKSGQVLGKSMLGIANPGQVELMFSKNDIFKLKFTEQISSTSRKHSGL